MKVCSNCEIEKDIEEFHNDKSRADSKTYVCKECECYRSKNYYENNKEKRSKQKKGYSRKRYLRNRKDWTVWLRENNHATCESCHYSKCLAAIEFHHTDPTEKKFTVGTFMRRKCNNKNKKTVKEEISKCKVLCANCHRELHNPQEE
jgi:hypothetical protein